MNLKVLKVGVGVTMNATDRKKLSDAAALADRIGQLPCDQAEKATCAAAAMSELIEAFKPAEEPNDDGEDDGKSLPGQKSLLK